MAIVLALLCGAASGQSVDLDRPLVPAAGLAAEGGPGMLWVNPANMAYDPDPRWGVFFSRDLGAGLQQPTGFALTGGASGTSVGVSHADALDEGSSWAFDLATSVRLPKRLALGVGGSWHLRSGGGDYFAWDVGASWRPLPWIGASAVARDVGSPAPEHGGIAESGAGLALRPFGQLLVVDGDYLHDFTPGDERDIFRATARIRPVRGLYLRGSWDTTNELTAGLEVYFGSFGLGSAGVQDDGDQGLVAFVGTDEPGETLVHAAPQIPVLDLDRTPPYQSAKGFFAPKTATYFQLLELMRRAETDGGVKGMVVVLGGANLSWAQCDEIRNRIRSLQDHGKKVIAYLHASASTADYYVASEASQVYIHPAQDLFLVGVSAEILNMRGFFDMVGVQPDFVRRAEYKSAVEQYTATEPSAPDLEQTGALLDDFHAALVEGIAEGRHRSDDEVKAWIDEGPWSSDDAVAKGMVDGVAYPDEVEQKLEQQYGHLVDVEQLEDMPQPHSGWKASSEIAIVYVEGVITPGASSSGGGLFGGGSVSTGSDTVVRQLDQARRDEQVKAVVLRVDSPGGSSFASDEIHRAVKRLQASGKPVVVSMGGVAASGGYYVSAGADAIWAEPTTITGSIGVYSGKFALGEALDRVGLHATDVTRGDSASMESMAQPWTAEERAKMEGLVDHTYTQFKQKVSDGRGLTMDQVQEVARGRVWSGRRAADNHLVDGLGGLHDAIKDAQTRAHIPDDRQVALVTYDNAGILGEAVSPTQMSLAARAAVAAFPGLASLGEPKEAPALAKAFGHVLGPMEAVAEHPEEDVWMLMPEEIDVK